jgi:hypothetical protein
MWSDRETTEDLLGFRIHADLLRELILDEIVLPVTIGVFGDWGSGKSSILKMIEQDLVQYEDKGTICIYLNGWVFEGYDDAKAALLESILEVFKDQKRFGQIVKTKADELIKKVNWMRLVGLGVKNVALPAIAAMINPTLGIEKLLSILDNPSEAIGKAFNEIKGMETEDLEKLSKETKEEKMLVREFREKFEELIGETDIKRLVVLIDDLDRCSPERLIENLEAIKLFLNVQKTAFVIGADPRIIKHAIEYRYSNRIDGSNTKIENQFVKDYLEKLIQIPYTLPKMSDSEVETYLTLLFCQKNAQGSFSKILTAFQNYREQNRYGAFGMGNIQSIISEDEKIKLGGVISLITSLGPIITDGLKGNPRQIKRFLNTFVLRRKLSEVAQLSEFRLEVLAKLMVLEYSHPELFRELNKWQSVQHGEPKELIELEEGQGMKTENKNISADWGKYEVQKWLQIEPKLQSVDLRDYFWISRDQLLDSISGASLIPPLIRELSKKLLEHGSTKILISDIETKLKKLPDLERTSLVSLLQKALVKNISDSKSHRVFLEMIKQQIPESLTIYQSIIGTCTHNDIPYPLSNDYLEVAKAIVGFQPIIDSIDKKSSLGKALLNKPKI